jgi:hypothetical protein
MAEMTISGGNGDDYLHDQVTIYIGVNGDDMVVTEMILDGGNGADNLYCWRAVIVVSLLSRMLNQAIVKSIRSRTSRRDPFIIVSHGR